MFLSATGDIGYAYTTALGPDIVLRNVWIWNIIFNADHLCIAAHDFRGSRFAVVGNDYDDVSTDAKLFEAEKVFV